MILVRCMRARGGSLTSATQAAGADGEGGDPDGPSCNRPFAQLGIVRLSD